MTKVNYNNSSQRSWVSRAVLCAILTISSMDVFGVDNTKDASAGSEASQNKTVTSEEAKELYSELPLHLAVWKRDEDLLRKQIKEHGTGDINEKAENGRTPLIIASINGDVNIAKILIEKGAEIDLKNDKGNTPLILAAYNNHLGMVKYLIQKKADVKSTNSFGLNALMYASQNGYINVVKYLIKNKKVVEDINHQSKKGTTALILAAMKGNAEIMQLLIKAGADVNIANKNGKTALSTIKTLAKNLTNILKNAGATESEKSKSTSKKRKTKNPTQKMRTQQKRSRSNNEEE